LALILAGISLGLLTPSPPRRIVLATGQAGGMYDAFGLEYANRLGAQGLRVEVVKTGGSIENLERVIQGKADVAFVQGGTYPLVQDPDGRVKGIAAIYLEPLWVFHRGSLSERKLTALSGRRIAIGPEGSGTEAASRILLREFGVTAASATLVHLSNSDARRLLEAGELDAAFFVTSYRDATIQVLLRRTDIHLLSFGREVAYTRKFPFFAPVKLSEGLLDLRDNLPPADVTLLAPIAQLVCRGDLHPRVVEQVLRVARTLHARGSLIDPPLRFPTLEGMDVPIHDSAETFFMSGESLLSQALPYWALRWISLLRVVVVPLLAIWLPFFKMLPLFNDWRARRLVCRLYVALGEVESALRQANEPATVRDGLLALGRLHTEMESLVLKVPPHRRGEVYHWRTHVILVRDEAERRLAAMEQSARA
jgi:TRAP transporter TAXI family solute receptor